MKRGLLPKIAAFIALFGIVIGILGTALLFILSPKGDINNNNNEEIKLTPEQLQQLKDISGSGSQTSSGTSK
nr:hypothetical protein [Candidatus Gracilibacteria bacterium]